MRTPSATAKHDETRPNANQVRYYLTTSASVPKSQHLATLRLPSPPQKKILLLRFEKQGPIYVEVSKSGVEKSKNKWFVFFQKIYL